MALPHRLAAMTAALWALLLAGVAHASPYASHPHRPPLYRDIATPSMLRSRDFDPEHCRLRLKSNTWDFCQEFLDRYELTLPTFYHMNPDVEPDCYNFVAGTEYCVAASKSHALLRVP